MLPGLARAIVKRDGNDTLIAQWPDDSILKPDLIAIANTLGIDSATEVKVLPLADSNDSQVYIATTLEQNKLKIGIAVFEFKAPQSQIDILQQLINWGKDWLNQMFILSREKSSKGSQQILELVEDVIQIQKIDELVATVVNRLAELRQFDRVALILIKNQKSSVKALSNVSEFDERNESVSLIKQVADYCIEHEQPVVFPNSKGDDAEEIKKLAVFEKRERIFAVPLLAHGYVVGAISCEYTRNPTDWSLGFAQVKLIARILAPLLHDRIAQAFSVKDHVWNKYKGRLEKWYKLRWLGLCGLAIIIIALIFIPVRHRVVADAQLEGRIQRAVVAPEDGYLMKAHSRAGELIKKGDVVVELDNRELLLEEQRWLGQKNEYQRLYSKELIALNQTQMQIYKAQLSQAEAQLQLLQQKLKRTKISAPIDGVIIQGDLSRAIGGPVEKGQVLFEMAPKDEFRLIIEVVENDIRFVSKKQSGELRLTSMPNIAIAFDIEAVSPIYRESEKGLVYRIEAAIEQSQYELKPGMKGVAKIDVGRRSVMANLFHDLANWFKLRWWSVTG